MAWRIIIVSYLCIDVSFLAVTFGFSTTEETQDFLSKEIGGIIYSTEDKTEIDVRKTKAGRNF